MQVSNCHCGYTLNLYNAMCQIYLHKAGENEKESTISQLYVGSMFTCCNDNIFDKSNYKIMLSKFILLVNF